MKKYLHDQGYLEATKLPNNIDNLLKEIFKAPETSNIFIRENIDGSHDVILSVLERSSDSNNPF
ncbi:MAG: hypothetical protein KDD53_08625, partial [Bdellovibrionales bacterium]|nr:hypothetical protein [Bdellovibrionales bacterium]